MNVRLQHNWRLAVDPENKGRTERWYNSVRPEAQPAPVPGIVQQVFPDQEGVFWYYCRFRPAVALAPADRALVCFGAVDYLAEVWLNGQPVGGHEGGETPFELDVTAALRPDADNLLAVRVLVPVNEPIDGIKLAETPHRNKVIRERYTCGSSYNYGGILLPVELKSVPAVRVTDLHLRPDQATGEIRVTVTTANDSGTPVTARLVATVAPAAAGQVLTEAGAEVTLPTGTGEAQVTLVVPQPRRWDLDDPYLYRVTVELTAGAHRHGVSDRCGFRDFRVVDGFFQLNGRRVFLKSTHTGNHFPIGVVVPPEPGLLCRDLLMAKVSGYNTVRFIAGIPYPEQLDFCDEIGLMVYEECLAGWCLGDSSRMAERFDRSVREMVRRDRNHPSVTIWGMLNETQDGPVFRQAVAGLKLVRELDDSRLVLLGSGRWDAQPAIGSVSNPGSREWEPVWGVEGPAAPKVDPALSWEPGGYVDRAGDAHIYPRLPLEDKYRRMVRTVGAGTKPVFLSEYGVGSQFNAIDELRRYEQAGARPDLLDVALIRGQADKLTRDLKAFGLDAVYPFPEDFLRASYAHSVEQRRASFDLIRSNPQLCGYNLTGMLDHGMTGEGMWTLWREWKPGVADVLRDGWAPLRWCLFVEPRHGYAGKPITVEAVLANEDVLKPGKYPVCFRIFSRERGVVWEETVTAELPATGPGGRPPLAVPVLKTTIRKRLPAGEYTFAASFPAGAVPRNDRLSFHLSDPAAGGCGRGTVAVLGIPAPVTRWLGKHGCKCQRFSPASRAKLVLVGEPPAGADLAALWAALREQAQRGATVVFLSAKPFMPGPEGQPKPLPLGDRVKGRAFHDWLYHKDIIAKQHPVFAGLPAGGLLDWNDYDLVVGHDLFDCADVPDEVVAAAFAVGYCCPGGYSSGIVVASYRQGRGRVILSSLDILAHVGRHPAADRLLLNLTRLR